MGKKREKTLNINVSDNIYGSLEFALVTQRSGIGPDVFDVVAHGKRKSRVDYSLRDPALFQIKVKKQNLNKSEISWLGCGSKLP